ncbi:unnamed protein product [Withania somnifera]
MSHAVFQTSQIMPMNTQIIPSSKTLLPPLLLHPVRSFKVSKVSVIKATASPAVDGDPVAFLEHCFQDSPAIDYQASSSSTMFAPVMKGEKYGAFGAVTLEKAKLDMSQQKQTKSSPEIATGGGGGNMGKNLNHGGGDGGDDDGDDDDYFDDFDDGDEGDEGGLFRRRMILQELFDRKFVDAVLNEWQKTMMDLPSGFRQAYEMGLVSSAQMVKFLSYNARPTVDRFISRLLPEGLARAFNGRKIADPAFLHKLLLDQATTIGCSVWWEVKNRKERIKQEWDLALLNVLTATACNAAVFWTLAPCHSYGNTFRYDLQNTLQKLPNNIFEKSYPLREFDLQKRIHSFFYKAAELCMLGLSAGAVQGALSNLLASKKEGRLSVSIPSVSNNALGYGAFLGVYANLRYQLLNGFDRAVFNYFDVIGVAVVFSTAMRGLDQSSSKWFISKNPIVSGLGLLGIKQGQSDSTTTGETSAPKARRKRVVRKKVAS